MEGKRLDLDAPLLSIRRITAQADCEKAAQPSLLRRKVLPFFSSNMNSGLVGNPGAVPFVWETKPGRPKDSSVGAANTFLNSAAPKLPPGRTVKENGADWLKYASTAPESEMMVFQNPTSVTCLLDDRNEDAKVEDEDEVHSTERVDEDDDFSDARDAFSCAESYSMKCSTSAGVRDHSKSLRDDSQFKDVMMDRFLPAAQAMAAGSLKRTWKKPPRSPMVHRENSIDQPVKSRLPLDYQYKLVNAQLHATLQEKEDVEEEYDGDKSYAGSGFFSSNACGLIHRLCLKNSFGKLNHDTSTKAKSKLMRRTPTRHSTQTKVLCDTSLGQTKDEDSWEDVYRYKLNHGYCPQKGEERKLGESNQLTCWSDSQMLDGSSFLNSTVSALSPNKLEDQKRESESWRGSSDSCEGDYGSFWETRSNHEKLKGSGSTSPAYKITFNQDSFHLQEIQDSKSSENIPSDTNTMIESSGNSSAPETEFQPTEESVVSETFKSHTLQSRSSNIAKPGFSPCCERINDREVDGNDLNDHNGDGLALNMTLSGKNDNPLTLSLLPPPLPTSPTESWLQRTLPSVSSNGPSTHHQSFLGIQLHPKKKVSWASACVNKSIIYEKPSNMHLRQARFMDVKKDA